MSFKSRKEYLISCITAAVGTLLSEDYYAQDFDNVIGCETPEQSACSAFIQFVKTMDREKALQYCSRVNFNNYLLSKREGSDSILDKEKEIVDLIYDRIDFNKTNNNEELREPNNLFSQLLNARKKLDLANRINNISEQEDYASDPVVWTDDFCNKVQAGLEDAASDYSNTTEDKLYFGDDVADFYKAKIEERENGEIYSFGNEMLDSLVTEGPTPGHGGIIGGSTGMGKSALCLNIINDLINADIPTIYFPIEMGVENTIDRLVSIRTGFPFKTIVNIGKNKSEDNSVLKKVILHEADSLRVHPNFAIDSKANVTMKHIRSTVKKFQSRLLGRKYCIVFIDLLLMIKEFYDDGSNMAQQIERAVNKLDILAKELGFHWVGVVQLNRSVESDKVLTEQSIEKLKPTRSAIKNSSALLERARWAITVFRKRYFADLYLTEEEAERIDDVAEIQLMKANDESISRRYMRFDGPTFKMTYDPDYGKSLNGF